MFSGIVVDIDEEPAKVGVFTMKIEISTNKNGNEATNM